MGLESKFSNDHDIIMKNILHHQADETIIFVFPWRSTYQQNPPKDLQKHPNKVKNENIVLLLQKTIT